MLVPLEVKTIIIRGQAPLRELQPLLPTLVMVAVPLKVTWVDPWGMEGLKVMLTEQSKPKMALAGVWQGTNNESKAAKDKASMAVFFIFSFMERLNM